MNWNLLKGIAYCFLWYCSIWTGFLFFCCPLLPFIILFPKKFVPIISMIFSIWEMYPVALMHLIFGTKIHISGDKINANETSLLLLNHRTRVDWNFLWAAMYYACNPKCHKLKMVLKAPLRHTPSFGWVMQVCGFLYIYRKWQQDEIIIKNYLQYYKFIGQKFQILIFPEGTDLSKKAVRKSDLFANENKLEKYEYVLHPRSRGFTLLVTIMRKNKQLEAVYDLTLAYPDLIPQTEYDVLRGVFPKYVHFYVKRYSIFDVPTEETELKSWLNKRWEKKEEILKDFYIKNRNFTLPYNHNCTPDNAIHLAFMFWTILIILMFYSLIKFKFFFWFALLYCLLFVILSFVSDGVQNLQITAYNVFRRVRKID